MMSWIAPRPVAALAVAALVGWSAGAALALTPEEVSASLAADFGVEVLSIEEADGPDGPAYVVTVMVPGGDTNDAFQVTRLMVDRETGALISQFRHAPSGVGGGEGAGLEVGEDSITRLRRGSFNAR